MGTVRRNRTSDVRGLTREVYVPYVSGFHYMVCIDSNHRDS
jgi:hypothetical protein